LPAGNTTEMPTNRPLISIVAPVYSEEECLEEFYIRVTAAVEAIAPPVDHELIFVDDGSLDRSVSMMQKFGEGDKRVRSLLLSRNFGHQVAITAGIDHAVGDAVVVIDADLQDPPGVIADMVESWRGGLKVVYGKRLRRHGETALKLVTAKAFYRLLGWLSDTPVPVDSGDFRLMDRKVVDALSGMREANRYLRGMVAWVGFPQGAVLYERDVRYAGTSKFSLAKMLRLALDAIVSFSEKPLRLTTRIGLLTTISSLLLAVWIVVSQLTGSTKGFPGYPSLMCAILFLGGVQLLSLGLVGAYLGRTYHETKRRPLYVVAERNGFPAG
jgi:glycosyltransferase involved in cell wall biosynthesis